MDDFTKYTLANSLITVLGMIITSYISYKSATKTIKLNSENELKKLEINFNNSSETKNFNDKQNLFLEYLSKAPIAYYIKNQDNYIDYLSVYRRFSLLCPENGKSYLNKVHKIIVESPSSHKEINEEFESTLNSLAIILQTELYNNKTDTK